jgi:hypothetical protein
MRHLVQYVSLFRALAGAKMFWLSNEDRQARESTGLCGDLRQLFGEDWPP